MVRRLGAFVSAAFAAVLVVGLASPASAESGWWVPTNPQAVESEVNITGEPHRGTNSEGEVVGFIDAHTHMFMDLGMGGNAVCGSTYSTKGIADALQDCKNHGTSLLENITNTSGKGIADKHDTTGWPTFKDWPHHASLTHQQMYYKWVERAWRGGQRIMVNDMVSNPALCPIIGIVAGPNKYNCNDMDTVRRQIQATYDLQTFIDNQYGGAGKGWYRVVKTPAEARQVIEAGKLAVVLGVEVSEPFGCKQTLGIANCSKSDIDKGLDEMKAKGVSSMFLCHKFDNALCGVRYDGGTTGVIVNVGQFLTTGQWWDAKTCKEGEVADHTVEGGILPDELTQITSLPAILPLYPKGPHCNPKGLTDLGEYALRGMIKRGMIVELDHMSAKAADRALDILEAEGYPGAVTSHSWMATEYQDRLFALGGFGASYGNGAETFVGDWNKAKPLLDKYNVGYGYGTDMNGFGGTPGKPSAAAQVSYPFTTANGNSTVNKQVTGERVWNFNDDGVAHYGMIPDWIESIRKVGGQSVIDDLNQGSESYLKTWAATTSWVKGENLARSGVATALRYETNPIYNYKPKQAIDGSTKTRYASGWNDHEWLQVDLGSTRQVSKVTIEWESAYGKDYQIQTSHDGVNWTTVSTQTNRKGGLDVINTGNASGRYVRWVGVKRGTKYGYSIKEFGIYS